jgi:hypothetical protein
VTFGFFLVVVTGFGFRFGGGVVAAALTVIGAVSVALTADPVGGVAFATATLSKAAVTFALVHV